MLLRLLALLSLLALAACGAPVPVEEDPEAATTATLPGYEGVQDGEFYIPPVSRKFLWGDQPRAEVAYAGEEKPGSIVVDTFARKLYYVLGDGRAMRYSIAVGREGIRFTGSGTIGRKAEWPSWQPTANMIRTRPDLYLEYANGRPGGPDNPLGARAMYLYRGNTDTMFRIHGTMDDASIGHATSAGCIRLFNQDAIDLYERVKMGAYVKVRSREESLAAEGSFMEDGWGRAVPDTPENRDKLDDQWLEKAGYEVSVAQKAADEAEAAHKAAKKALTLAEREAEKAERALERASDEMRVEAIAASREAKKVLKEAAEAEADAAEAVETTTAALEKALAAEEALKARIAECEEKGIEPAQCPPPGKPLSAARWTGR